MNKKVHIITRGCQMNIRDSEFVMGLLMENGFELAPSIDKADIVIFNSCSVRKHAEDRLISNISDLTRLKKKRPNLIVGLIGCTAQNYKEKILEKLPILDFSCGPGNEADIVEIINDILKDRCQIIATDKVDTKRQELFPKHREHAFKAYVSIGEGCNNFCSYCIVPYVRGRERSRRSVDILKEVKDLASRGFKEIMLLGQNVNSYEGTGFVKLLEKLNKVDGIERIRFMTSHPKDASIELFKAMRDLDKVCEHLHLPLQSGSDKILRLMNRDYTQKKYLKLAEDYRKLLPEGSLTTDIIVGFPGEEDVDFSQTIAVLKEVKFDSAFTFKYSLRPPAKSSQFEDDVSRDVKEERLEIAMNLQAEISRKQNEVSIGNVVEVLVDGESKKIASEKQGQSPSAFAKASADRSGTVPVFPRNDELTGRTRANKVMIFEGDKSLIGGLVKVKIDFVTPHTLRGKLI